ncbi:MAG: PQQ-dependent sugar dehydrogenase [Acidimicrobiales bacterium]
MTGRMKVLLAVLAGSLLLLLVVVNQRARSAPSLDESVGGPVTETTVAPEAGQPGGGGPPAVAANQAGPVGQGPGASVRLVTIARLASPVALATRPDDPALYVVEKVGRVQAVDPTGRSAPRLVLDLTDQVSGSGEQGLLGLDFSPDGDLLYVNYTDVEGNTRVVEYKMDGGEANVASARLLLRVEQPFGNHNGGNLVMGPDKMLWVGLGDGGSGNDPGNRSQNPATLLGKMVRIDPRPSGDRPYTVPADNPFVGREGFAPEIWSLGLRNPWRYSFDRENGDLWMGDVGQNAVEEINREPAGNRGRNYGWSRFEGTRKISDRTAPGAVPPAFEYAHAGSGGCSVTGGYVYRGQKIQSLVGLYLYSDFCTGGVRALRPMGTDGAAEAGDLGLDVASVASFGQDADGEIYVLSFTGTVSRLSPA